MRLWIDPIRLASYGLTVLDVRDALNSQNVELPSGKLTGENTELSVKTVGNLANVEEFNNIIIKVDNNRIIRLSDVGNAALEAENFETKMSDSGFPMVALAVIPQPGTNYLEIADRFYVEYDKL